MFDIGPSELLVIFVVALLVIGPERLPAAVRTASLWVGRFRRSFHKIKADVERELNADEIRRQLHNESILAEVEEAKSQAEELVSNAERAAVEELGLESNTQESATDGNGESDNHAEQAETGKTGTASASQEETAEPTVGGEIKQAVSYVNDISRDVQASTKEIQDKIKNPGFANKDKSGDNS